MKSGNQQIIFCINSSKNLRRAIPVTTVSMKSTGTALFDNLIIPYGILTYVLTDNGLQFELKLFETITVPLGIKDLRTNASHPSSSCQVERFSQTIVAHL